MTLRLRKSRKTNSVSVWPPPASWSMNSGSLRARHPLTNSNTWLASTTSRHQAACGENTKVRFAWIVHGPWLIIVIFPVDYILFLTADVTVVPNVNEIRDHKYVSKEELQAMFDDKGNTFFSNCMKRWLTQGIDNLFTPWFKLIARDFLFGWWDELYKRKSTEGKVVAKSLAGIADGGKVIKMTWTSYSTSVKR